MNDFEYVVNTANSPVVTESLGLSDLLGKWLFLGQTRYVCRHGTLSEGHEKLTAAQRYSQAIKELYYLSLNISGQKVLAKRSQADLLEAQIDLDVSKSLHERLRAEADIEEAKSRLFACRITIQDQMRMVDEYNKIRLELKDEVEAAYENGEQAEARNWEAVARHRMINNHNAQMNNIPLSPEHKAELGQEFKRHDMKASLFFKDEKKLHSLEDKWQKITGLSSVREIQGQTPDLPPAS